MKVREITGAACLAWCAMATLALGAECRLVGVTDKPTGVDPSILERLTTGGQVLRLTDDEGDETELCRVWVSKTWTLGPPGEVTGDFAPILYPLAPGSLVGVVQLSRGCIDFRDQELPAGTYTLRYAVQPDLDVHRESHDSRDFLVLLPVEDDRSPELMADEKQLLTLSAKVTLTPHPAIIPLTKPGDGPHDVAIRRDERDPNGWILSLCGHDQQQQPVPLDLIVLRASAME